MLKKFLREQRGQSAAIAAFVIIVLIAAAGLALDGTRLVCERAKLEAATEAAALSTIGAVDMDLYCDPDNPRVELIQPIAEYFAVYYLNLNMQEAQLESCTVDPSKPNQAVIKSSVEVELIFMKAFGIDTKTVKTTVTGHVE